MTWRRLLIVPPIALGVFLFMWMTEETGDDSKAEIPEAALAVRVQQITPEVLVASASGFGRVKAVETWHAISQVTGRAAVVSENVAVGEVVKAGDLLVRIDPRDYEIALAKVQTSIASARAAIQELEASTSNTTATLALEQEIEAFYQTELGRQQELVERGAVSQTTLDKAQRLLLTQQKVVLALNNSLNLAPVKRKTLEATLASRLAQLEEAERALANTVIKAPFDGRLTVADVSVQEFVRSGDTLLEIDNTAASEVIAQFQPNIISNLFRSASVGIKAQGLNLSDPDMAAQILERLQLTAQVEVASGDETHVWPAKLIRINGATDTETGTIGVVVQVENPSLPDPATLRPPLVNGVFARVRLDAPEQADTILIGRDLLRITDDGETYVYTMTPDQRLERRDISVGAISGSFVVVTAGLAAGDQLVLSDPQPAIQGMLLDPVAEQQRAEQ